MNIAMECDWEVLRKRLVDRLGGGWSLEPASVLSAVAAHREYWKPDEVRMLLLAESHVLTHAHELAARVDLAPHGHVGAPSEFVRLVYCLGYGENEIVDRAVEPNPGTWQFWKLFAACVDDRYGSKVLKGAEPDTDQRIRAKIALLKRLKARGVWLLDASPVALYRPGGSKPRKMREALSIAWSEYAAATVRAVQPRAVMVIGKMVYDAVGEHARRAAGSGVDVQWMYQPQARVSAEQHTDGLRRLRGMVERYGCRS